MLKDEKPKQRDAQRECIALGECRPRHASKKDTKRWCRGRVGVEHQWDWRALALKSASEVGELGFRREQEICVVCDRLKDRYSHYTKHDRARCHCGELMQRVEYRHRLDVVVLRGGFRCDVCAYEPSCYLPTRWVDGHNVLAVERRRCQCEITIEREAKRAKYHELYGAAPAAQEDAQQ